MSEVIRAEAETCFLEIMKINILMLLLFVMIINNLVLTEVAIIQNIMGSKMKTDSKMKTPQKGR